MERHRIIDLYERWKSKHLTAAEVQELCLLLQDKQAERVLKAHWDKTWEGLSFEEIQSASGPHYEAIFQTISRSSLSHARRQRIRINRVAIAACLLATLFFGYLVRQNRAQRIPLDRWATAHDIAPGGHRATLSLGDGRIISLSEAKQGIIMGEALLYNDSSFIGAAASSGKSLASVQQATLRTPKGGQYQVTLPDGTKVWLNATTSLTYPTSFSGAAQRRVTLKGEAYFEVAPDKQHPFIVTTEKQEVQVLGTHFNISAFPEDKETRTTLVEGLVEVRPLHIDKNQSIPPLRIMPSEQSILSDQQFHKKVVHVEQAIAWKNGYFLFEDEPIQSVMKKIEKWYDIDVYYAYGRVTDERFNGMIARNKPISEVLRMLEETGAVHFRIKDKEVYVYP